MNRNRWVTAALVCTALAGAGLLRRANADASDEIKRLAALMDWKPETIVADIGAGDGSYPFVADQPASGSGKVFATAIDQGKLASLRSDVAKRNFPNVVIFESKEATTNLPRGSCV